MPIRHNKKGKWQLLLVRNYAKPDLLLFPRGGILPCDKTLQDTALRGTMEKAGVVGTIKDDIGFLKFDKGRKRQHMFILEVKEVLSESDPKWRERKSRERKWCTIEECGPCFDRAIDQYKDVDKLIKILKAAVTKLPE